MKKVIWAENGQGLILRDGLHFPVLKNYDEYFIIIFLLFYQCSFRTLLRQRVLLSCIRLIMVKRCRTISVFLESLPFVKTSIRIIGAITLNKISLKEKNVPVIEKLVKQ